MNNNIPHLSDEISTSSNPDRVGTNDSLLPEEWNKKSDCVFGLSDSLYDRNQVTKIKNGDPIADCFGVIARNDSAILALADGVNWGLYQFLYLFIITMYLFFSIIKLFI